ncbi:MAG: AraC family transcriptional regulator, partial [Bacteroidota bacterium]|nr:AraC family transcriptional regulator [Bacteroidota bacterium]
MSLQATVIRDILHHAPTYGAAYDQLSALSGFAKEDFTDSEKLVEWEKSARLWDLLVELTGDELIGLHMGLEITPATLGMVGLLVQSSKNVSEAFKVYVQYGYMVCAMIDLTYTEAGRTATVEFHQNSFWRSRYPVSARQGLDNSLSGTLN